MYKKTLARCIFKVKKPWDVIREIENIICANLFKHNEQLGGIPVCYFLKAVGSLAKIDEECFAEVETNIEFIVEDENIN
ncbi:hypothetical protein EHP00_1900 [Ecytonucleospora hepatopenaei]|uniref:Uncharacterized protein n=1 Tax=Ecytonucleospora hepatopenaei TaxID=646526 RepID=A0A1W0E3H5_9MICR|nr:hypothetical protein EHP00_1900 [Ecytonucleospora hepatopenaei]